MRREPFRASVPASTRADTLRGCGGNLGHGDLLRASCTKIPIGQACLDRLLSHRTRASRSDRPAIRLSGRGYLGATTSPVLRCARFPRPDDPQPIMSPVCCLYGSPHLARGRISICSLQALRCGLFRCLRGDLCSSAAQRLGRGSTQRAGDMVLPRHEDSRSSRLPCIRWPPSLTGPAFGCRLRTGSLHAACPRAWMGRARL